MREITQTPDAVVEDWYAALRRGLNPDASHEEPITRGSSFFCKKVLTFIRAHGIIIVEKGTRCDAQRGAQTSTLQKIIIYNPRPRRKKIKFFS